MAVTWPGHGLAPARAQQGIVRGWTKSSRRGYLARRHSSPPNRDVAVARRRIQALERGAPGGGTMNKKSTVDDSYDIATDRPGRLTAPPSLPARPGWRPPTAAPARAGRPEGGDPFATAVPPGRSGHPAGRRIAGVCPRRRRNRSCPQIRPSLGRRGDTPSRGPGGLAAAPGPRRRCRWAGGRDAAGRDRPGGAGGAGHAGPPAQADRRGAKGTQSQHPGTSRERERGPARAVPGQTQDFELVPAHLPASAPRRSLRREYSSRSEPGNTWR